MLKNGMSIKEWIKLPTTQKKFAFYFTITVALSGVVVYLYKEDKKRTDTTYLECRNDLSKCEDEKTKYHNMMLSYLMKLDRKQDSIIHNADTLTKTNKEYEQAD